MYEKQALLIFFVTSHSERCTAYLLTDERTGFGIFFYYGRELLYPEML